jgi:hypothetical protein
MSSQVSTSRKRRLAICSLEADMAFFEARLSFAGASPDTSYQRAQIKTYETLGLLLAGRLKAIESTVADKDKGSSAAA